MVRRMESFDLYHLGLGVICAAIFFLGCAPPPHTAHDDVTPAVDSTVDPTPLETERKGKIDIDIGGGKGVDIDIEGRAENPAN
ncbi:hypothetical protein LOC68_18740 [Blastopirellula sp. JC732]|uniref:Uncharacterized protein n=1 Tax=Blastopirellula sediminis TaxID=2894196 RepID=A0A9X1MQ72_9BACT|nr:hypothetical protein [Blastopirellula sediminis]MCC9606265.1 hypothetical protein [Blastopirellula sediminis]MCC9630437.1 hypothetical protein [Blastopirellula sediminis]